MKRLSVCGLSVCAGGSKRTTGRTCVRDNRSIISAGIKKRLVLSFLLKLFRHYDIGSGHTNFSLSTVVFDRSWTVKLACWSVWYLSSDQTSPLQACSPAIPSRSVRLWKALKHTSWDEDLASSMGPKQLEASRSFRTHTTIKQQN
jgi:hypothetical protein